MFPTMTAIGGEEEEVLLHTVTAETYNNSTKLENIMIHPLGLV